MTGDDNSVGSVAEEAAKLLGALQGWARENGSDYANAATAAAGGAAATASSINEHIATGSAECKFCPICQVVSAVRATSPEVKQHLSTAAASLLQATAALMATHPAARQGPEGQEPIEKIDISDQPWDED